MYVNILSQVVSLSVKRGIVGFMSVEKVVSTELRTDSNPCSEDTT